MGILEEKKKIEMRVSEDSRRETAHAIQPFGEKAHLLLKIKILMWGAGGVGGNLCRCVKTTNHQFHITPKTVLNTRPISIQTFLIPFGAFDALKGLIVPSSALL